MSALQHKFEMEQGNGRNKAVMINLVNVRIEVCKMKAATSHFESVIALFSICQA